MSSYSAGRRGEHYGRGTTFSRAVRAPLSFCHSEELQFRGICFAASPDREQGFPRRLPPARGFQKRGSIGTGEAVPFPTLGNSRADTIRLRFVSGHAFMRAVRVGRFASCRGRRGKNITGRARLSVVPLWPLFRFVIPRNFGSEESALQLLHDREQGFPRRLPPARDYERRGSIGTSKTRALPKICADVSRGWAVREEIAGRARIHACRYDLKFDSAPIRRNSSR